MNNNYIYMIASIYITFISNAFCAQEAVNFLYLDRSSRAALEKLINDSSEKIKVDVEAHVKTVKKDGSAKTYKVCREFYDTDKISELISILGDKDKNDKLVFISDNEKQIPIDNLEKSFIDLRSKQKQLKFIYTKVR